ncbi:MAG TPA: hypothetical protein VFL57_13730 [Bryobacteraceae bacterium]|nr:hypothetical protein [Bryobacteraceae bacterium]
MSDVFAAGAILSQPRRASVAWQGCCRSSLVEEHSMATAGFLKRQRPSAYDSRKPMLTTPDAIAALCREANAADACVGLITWMHTFSARVFSHAYGVDGRRALIAFAPLFGSQAARGQCELRVH